MRPHPVVSRLTRRSARPATVGIAIGIILVLPTAPLSTVGAAAGTSAPQKQGNVRIQVLSNRADLVSSGDVLVRITAPRRAGRLRVTLDGRDISKKFRQRSTVLLRGLDNGRNVLLARAGNARRDRVVITNHRHGGPSSAAPSQRRTTARTPRATRCATSRRPEPARPLGWFGRSFRGCGGGEGVPGYPVSSPLSSQDSNYKA